MDKGGDTESRMRKRLVQPPARWLLGELGRWVMHGTAGYPLLLDSFR